MDISKSWFTGMTEPMGIHFKFSTSEEITDFIKSFKEAIDEFGKCSVAYAGNLYFNITGSEGLIDNMFNHMRGWTTTFLNYGLDGIGQDSEGYHLYLSEPIPFVVNKQEV